MIDMSTRCLGEQILVTEGFAQGKGACYDPTSQSARSWPCRPRLAEYVPHFLVRRLLRPAQMGFRSLRVINEDHVAPGHGLWNARPPRHGDHLLRPGRRLAAQGQHGKRLGSSPGEFQRISAGTGIRHSEFNPSATEPVHFYQIWLLPRAKAFNPVTSRSYSPTTKSRPPAAGRFARRSQWLADIHQDARASTWRRSAPASRSSTRGRPALWLQALRGKVDAGGHGVQAGDGLSVSDEARLAIAAEQAAEVMLFDLVSPVNGYFHPPRIRRTIMHVQLQGPLTVLGRLLLCTIFVMAAVGNDIPNFGATTKQMESVGVPAPPLMLIGAIAFSVVGSFSVVVGFRPIRARECCWCSSCWPPGSFMHFGNWKGQGAKGEIEFMKNLSMVGAMLFIMANGSGPMSLDGCAAESNAAPTG